MSSRLGFVYEEASVRNMQSLFFQSKISFSNKSKANAEEAMQSIRCEIELPSAMAKVFPILLEWLYGESRILVSHCNASSLYNLCDSLLVDAGMTAVRRFLRAELKLWKYNMHGSDLYSLCTDHYEDFAKHGLDSSPLVNDLMNSLLPKPKTFATFHLHDDAFHKHDINFVQKICRRISGGKDRRRLQEWREKHNDDIRSCIDFDEGVNGMICGALLTGKVEEEVFDFITSRAVLPFITHEKAALIILENEKRFKGAMEFTDLQKRCADAFARVWGYERGLIEDYVKHTANRGFLVHLSLKALEVRGANRNADGDVEYDPTEEWKDWNSETSNSSSSSSSSFDSGSSESNI